MHVRDEGKITAGRELKERAIATRHGVGGEGGLS